MIFYSRAFLVVVLGASLFAVRSLAVPASMACK